jgi:acyl-CoA thioester hydrolase
VTAGEHLVRREFRHSSDIEVRFRDSDAMGHTNHAVYLTYAEVARQRYWKHVAPDATYDDVPFVIAHAELDFHSPTRSGEVLRVYVRTNWVSRGSFGMVYEIRGRDDDRLVATAMTVLATYDYSTRAAMPVPDWMRRGLENAEGRRLPGKPEGAAQRR